SEPEGDPALEPESVGLTPELMAQIPAKILRMYVPGATLAEALPHLRETYCGTIAYEIEHIASHRQRVWLRERIETSDFRGPISAESERASTLEAVTTIPQGGTGDVKYHHGTQGSYQLPDGATIRVNLESNPSHLEYVYPVVEGATRAAQTTRHGPHAHQDTDAALPIAIHGDASLPAQGVVAETLNLQGLDGYK